MKKIFFFSKILLYTFRLLKKSKHAENIKGIQSKAGLTGHRKTHYPEVQRKNLTDLSFIRPNKNWAKKIKKQQVVIQSFIEELTFRELIILKKWDSLWG